MRNYKSLILILLSGLIGTAMALGNLHWVTADTFINEPTFLVGYPSPTPPEDAFLKLPPTYAILDDEDGQLALLSLVTESRLLQLQQAHPKTSVLLQTQDLRDIYLVYLPDEQAENLINRMGTLLTRHGKTGVMQLTAQARDTLATQGIRLAKIPQQPLVLTSPAQFPAPASPPPDPQIEEIIDKVSSSSMYNYIGSLSGEWYVQIGGAPYQIWTRNSSYANETNKATQYAYEYFQSLGLDVKYDEYIHDDYGLRRNVVAEQRGITDPDCIYMITAHMDNMPWTPYNTRAPGADDNASGSAGVMTAAEVLSQYDFACTIRYALFTGEEQGLIGSREYAEEANAHGDDIRGVINLDMIGYDSDVNPIVDIYTRPGNKADQIISTLFNQVVSAYQINLDVQIWGFAASYSDHYSFWSYGFPAILVIEDDDDFTPYYHTVNDKLSTLNKFFFTHITQASVGTIAHLAGLLPEGWITGEVTDASNGVPLADIPLTLHTMDSVFTTTTTLSGTYHIALPGGDYTVSISNTGYLPLTMPGVEITNGLTTILDLQLTPCTPIYGLSFSYTPPFLYSGDEVALQASILSGTLPITYSWVLGDNTQASGTMVTHTYPLANEAKAYLVTLSATNLCSNRTYTQTLTVHPYQLYIPFTSKP